MKPFWTLERLMARFMVRKTQAFSFMVFLFLFIKPRWGLWRWTHPCPRFPNLPHLFPFSHMGLGIRGISFCPRHFIHVFKWFPISFILSLKVYGFNLWVYSWLGYQKRMFKFLRTGKDNFGFFFYLHHYNYIEFSYVNN